MSDYDSDPDHPSSQYCSQPSETYLLGFVIANIVGLQYYSGRISGREMVGLVREPLNPYDSNALRVFNTRSVQVGHIERSVAAVLSPLIDSNLIGVEGIVPNSQSAGNRFRIPCQVHIFCKVEAFGIVKEAILEGGLVLVSSDDASFGLSEAMVVKEERKRNRSVDEIFRLLDESVVGRGKGLDKLDAPREVVKSGLFVHQKEGLGWLVRRERSEELPPFWKKSEEMGGGYINELTNYWTDLRPEPLRGGIFADDMGLGKTLSLISLIALDKFAGSDSSDAGNKVGRVDVENNVDELEDDNDEEYVSGKRRKGKRGGKVSKRGSGPKKKRKTAGGNKSVGAVDNGEPVQVVKATLVVCPPSVISSWIMQLAEHTTPGKLKVYLYYGERTSDIEELRKYDIVLTTYSILATEESWEDSPVKKIEWWRVILDEAHVIKNVKAQQSRAVINLKAKRRWVVTGTPIQNGSQDLFSLMSFLRFEPFSIKGYWNSLIQRPLHQGDQQGLSRLQILMATISLRRTKEKGLIGLPEKTIETCYIDLSTKERSLYDEMERKVKSVVRQYIDADSFMRNYATMLSVILRLRQICISSALCPPDLVSLLPSNNIEDVSNNPELLKKVLAVLQDGEDFDCPICISPPTDIIITRCAHIFCRACILKTFQNSKRSCPLCRRPLTDSDLFSAPPETTSNQGDVEHSSKPFSSSKVLGLIRLLAESRDRNPTAKSVVFSQFRRMLVLLEEPLTAAGFKVLRLDGSMNAKKRGEVIQEFGEQKGMPTILLASLKAAGTGINLTAASTVYLLEPWWNPAVEEQAMDRVHRIGQKEDVRVVKLIARNSIEERILALQDQKKMVAREAFDKKAAKEQREIGWNDLRMLVDI